MNLRKFISGVSALAIAASAFAGMAVTASAAATTYTDDLSSYSENAGSWWTTANENVTYSIEDSTNYMVITNSSTGSAYESVKDFTTSSTDEQLTISGYFAPGRMNNSATTMAFYDASGTRIFEINNNINSNFSVQARGTADAYTTISGATYIDKFNFEAVVNYKTHKVTVTVSNCINNKSATVEGGSHTFDTTATAGAKVTMKTKIRKAGSSAATIKFGNLSLVGLEHVIDAYAPAAADYSITSTDVTETTEIKSDSYWAVSDTGKDITFSADIYVPASDGHMYLQPVSRRTIQGVESIAQGSELRFDVSNGSLTVQSYTGSGKGQQNNFATGLTPGRTYRVKMTAYNQNFNSTDITGKQGIGEFRWDVTDLTSGTNYPLSNVSVRNLSGSTSQAWNRVRLNGYAVTEGDPFFINNAYSYATLAKVDTTADNATVTGTPTYVGQPAKITVTADDNYTVDSVTFNGSELTANEDGTYTIKPTAVGQALVVNTSEDVVPTANIQIGTVLNKTVYGTDANGNEVTTDASKAIIAHISNSGTANGSITTFYVNAGEKYEANITTGVTTLEPGAHIYVGVIVRGYAETATVSLD